jgi:hypothetical protein
MQGNFDLFKPLRIASPLRSTPPDDPPKEPPDRNMPFRPKPGPINPFLN